MKIFVDIDETICKTPASRDYRLAKPIEQNIARINQLYDQGHTIVYWTARGTTTGIDWRQTTEQQFKKWHVRYHKLLFNKPNYDLFIDDKNISLSKDLISSTTWSEIYNQSKRKV